ncbi:MAG: nicotinate-nucleotide--dimethylbenzimidazole phosphoribosyltransferase [Thermoanaerobacteraceae bacterium]|nr:nicotinate-nucleotide--dimethylbenzimidazole phosphoribosyltransferase [Thermoanaerobacteraceae bacterium]
MLRLNETIETIEPLDNEAMRLTQRRLDSLTKPQGSLGRLEEVAVRIAGITGKYIPDVPKKLSVLMAADHGVVVEGVSAFPQDVTMEMVENFIKGGAAMNVLSKHVGSDLWVVDIGVKGDISGKKGIIHKKIANGTSNMAKGQAMTRDEAIRAIEVGISMVVQAKDQGYGLIGTGEMGIGNTTASTAIVCAFSGLPPSEVVGRGTGVDDEGMKRKIETIEKALDVNRPDPNDPLDVLSKVGGLEIAGLAGVFLGCAAMRIPVLIDGFISGAAALVAYKLKPLAGEYMIASHLSMERGHRIELDMMGLKPLLDLDMRLGEGTGAALAMGIVDASIKIIREMATFEEAGVSEKE